MTEEILDLTNRILPADGSTLKALVPGLIDLVLRDSRRSGERGNRRHALEAERESVSS
ncbi:MAG: hypothetical protein ABF291_10015 [Desulfobacterales bacterium]